MTPAVSDPAASDPAASETVTRCPSCAASVARWEAFCEGCGAALVPSQVRPSAIVADEVAGPRASAMAWTGPIEGAVVRSCTECGSPIAFDGYCEQCGARAPSERDHFSETPASWAGGVCDRGVRHHRNEDAMALSAEPVPGSQAVLVVCDGVSSSDGAHVASLAAARAARDVLIKHRPVGMAVPHSQARAMIATMGDAVKAANDAVVLTADPASENAASCTIAAAQTDGDLIVWGTIGDSRVYWLADTGPSRQLSVDDSVARLNMAAGMSRKEAETGPGSHAITRWLGSDAPDLAPAAGHLVRPGDGWLLVCSDGLWNYASDPAELETVIAQIVMTNPAAADPTTLAGELVRWANAQGGRDNITVAVARFGSLDGFLGHRPMARENPLAPMLSAPTRHTVPRTPR